MNRELRNDPQGSRRLSLKVWLEAEVPAPGRTWQLTPCGSEVGQFQGVVRGDAGE